MFSAAPHTPFYQSANGGEHIDPEVDSVLVTTGELPAGNYLCMVTLATTDLADSQARFTVEHRDVLDQNALETIIVSVPVANSLQVEVAFRLEANERISVVPYVDIVGTVMAALNWQRIA